MCNIKKVISSELCVGCGVCTLETTSSMQWNKLGFLEPAEKSNVEVNYKLCPFNITPDDEVKTEDELAEIFLDTAPNSHTKAGRYYNTYVGYAKEFRTTSSSGGLATYVLCTLLDNKQIDYVVSVGESKGLNSHYTYKISRTREELLQTSKTKYYPVSMSEALKQMEQLDGKGAIVGTACFVKAIRLLQYYKPEFKEKIQFIVGIICGGQKSKFYADFLASHLGLEDKKYKEPQFRIKDKTSYALDYSFGAKDFEGKKHTRKMRGLGDMWGTGVFKNNACDFCDDVTTELADISLGDAWIKPYSEDGEGNNVVVTRSFLAEQIINDGIKKGSLQIEVLPFDSFLQSQQGSFNHRHKGLNYRIRLKRKKGQLIPPKRHDKESIRFDFKMVQRQRLRTRTLSLDSWVKGGRVEYNKVMPRQLRLLKVKTRFNHYIRAVKRRLSL